MEDKMELGELQEVVSICLDQIVLLKEENERLKQQIDSMQETLNKTIEFEKTILDRQKYAMEGIVKNRHIINKSVENIKYELQDPNRDMSTCYTIKILPVEESIELLVKERASMGRYGDGEFAIMQGIKRQRFQEVDERLASRLREVIRVNEKGFLVGIADNYGSLDKYNEDGKQEIRCYMTAEIRKQHLQFLDLDREYHNTYISRPYALFADNSTEAPKKRFENLRRIWENREVIFVEGAQTRLGVGNDLFNNAKSIHRILAPATDSFRCYDELLEISLKHAKKDTLFLIALGPTAGVLAYDLFKEGYQAIDIGHLDMEYEWYLVGNGGRCEVKNKYNNEVLGGDVVEEVHDLEYEQQILYKCQ